MSFSVSFDDKRAPGTAPWFVNEIRVTSPATLAKAVGVRLERRSKLTLRWDGHSINTNGLHAAGVVHEIAHWLLASPWRRTLPEFGLGASSHGGMSATRALTYERAKHEERLTLVIQAAAGIAMGLLPLERLKQCMVIGWDIEELDAVCDELRTRNLLGDAHQVIVEKIRELIKAEIRVRLRAQEESRRRHLRARKGARKS